MGDQRNDEALEGMRETQQVMGPALKILEALQNKYVKECKEYEQRCREKMQDMDKGYSYFKQDCRNTTQDLNKNMRIAEKQMDPESFNHLQGHVNEIQEKLEQNMSDIQEKISKGQDFQADLKHFANNITSLKEINNTLEQANRTQNYEYLQNRSENIFDSRDQREANINRMNNFREKAPAQDVVKSAREQLTNNRGIVKDAENSITKMLRDRQERDGLAEKAAEKLAEAAKEALNLAR